MTKIKHQWIITFEGSCDCTGKTTLINKFNKATNFQHLLRDRGTLSTRAYAKKFDRDIGDFSDIEEYISNYKYHVLVYLTADKEDVVKRQAIKNDGWDSNDYDLDKELFDEMLETSWYSRVIFLNSSEMSYEEEIDTIIQRLEKYEEQYRNEAQDFSNIAMRDIDGQKVDFGDIVKYKNFLFKVKKVHDGSPQLHLTSFTLHNSLRPFDDYYAISSSKLIRKGDK